MNGKLKTAGGLAAVLGMLAGGFQVWGFLERWAQQRADQASWRTEVEARLCELEGGRWWRGECERPESPR